MTNKTPLRLRVNPRFYVLPLFAGSLIFAGYANNAGNASTVHTPRIGETITGNVSAITLRTRLSNTYENKVTLTTSGNLTATFNASDIDLERLPMGQGVSVTLRRCPAELGKGRMGSVGLLCVDTSRPIPQ